MSESVDLIAAPRDREKALSAAYLRHLGASQVDAAKATGVDARTLGRWESSSWWVDVQREAAKRWLAGLAAKARRSLEGAVEKDGNLALKVLERLEPSLAPVHLRLAVSPTIDFGRLTDEQLERIASGKDPGIVIASR